MCNLRGAVLPVVQISDLLGQAPDAGRFIVVATADGMVAGIVVDDILGVEPLPAELDAGSAPGVRGSALVGGELVGVLDAGAILRSLADAGEG